MYILKQKNSPANYSDTVASIMPIANHQIINLLLYFSPILIARSLEVGGKWLDGGWEM
jgi:hypothetical protein